jgi:hypothetical protein
MEISQQAPTSPFAVILMILDCQESEVKKRIFFNAFHMNCVVHQSPGLWVRPEDQMTRYTDLKT